MRKSSHTYGKTPAMEKLFSKKSPHLLNQVKQAAGRRMVLAFDYDGTLAPIVSDILRARMRPETVRLFRQVVAAYPTAIVSGRGYPDLEKLIRAQLGSETIDREGLLLIGSHGMQWGKEGKDGGGKAESARHAQWVAGWMAAIRSELAEVPGLEIEDKRVSVSIHYRHSPHPAKARRLILATLSRLDNVRVVGGKLVYNLVPRDAADKGSAIQELRRKLRASDLLFVGDDVTDEDAFAVRAPWVHSVRVGSKRSSLARYYLSTQEEIDRLLEFLLAAKSTNA